MQLGANDAIDIADETGMMAKFESSIGQVNFTFDKKFWDAALADDRDARELQQPSVDQPLEHGNENMWGWIYQGEAAKVLGNRQQIRIVKAMREADPMKRPSSGTPTAT